MSAANGAGIPLTAYGYFDGDKSKNLMPKPPIGTPTAPLSSFHTYFVYCAAVSEVEIDVLTGEITVLSVDIVYDNGVSLNPKIDRGQIEGGLVMALGW